MRPQHLHFCAGTVAPATRVLPCPVEPQALSPFYEGMPAVTHNEIVQEIQKLTEEIRTLSYSSTKAAAEKILQLQQRRRELRAQLEAAEP